MKYVLMWAIAGVLLLSGCAVDHYQVPETVAKQQWLVEKPFKLTCGDHSFITGKRFNGKVAGWSFKGKELFVKAGSTQLGTLYETPFPKDKNAVYSIAVDGITPDAITGDITAREKIEITRQSDYGDLKIFAFYTLTPEGWSWSVKYRIVSEKHPARYFYLFTAPWNNKFIEFAYVDKGKLTQGRMSNSKKWRINSALDKLAMYAPELKVGVVTEVVGNLPTEIRHHTLWDLPYFHKYFLFHAKPEWKAGYESPVYTLKFRAFEANEKDFIEKSNIK